MPAPLHEALLDDCGARAIWMRAEDGIRLRLGLWNEKGRRGTIFVFPGRTEYIEKYGAVLPDLAARGYAVAIIDWRGQGLSDRLIRDPVPGHVTRFTDYQHDVRAMVQTARDLALPKPWFLLTHSMGGAIGLRALIEGLPVQAVCLSAPMWDIWLHPKPKWAVRGLAALGTGLGLGTRLAPGQARPPLALVTDFGHNQLTSDPDQFARMRGQATAAPELTLGGPSYQWVQEALAECRHLATLPSPDLPCVVGLGTDEAIIDPRAIHARMPRWRGARLDIYDGVRHELMMERPEHLRRFLDGADALFRSAAGTVTG